MTKRLLLATLTALLLAVPIAAAHGAPESRSIDTRAVADNTDFGDYGGSASLPPPFIAPALDLLALDVREGFGPGDAPGLWFRLISQAESLEGQQRVDISFDLAGTTHAYSLSTTDQETWTGDFDVVGAGVPVGDGHPKAVDAFLAYATVNASIGDTITSISATSYADDTEGDTMPGGYTTAVGSIILPQDGSVTQDYTLAGPAQLLRVTTDVELIAVTAASEASFVVQVENTVPDMEQFVEASIRLPAGATGSVSPSSVILSPNETAQITVDLGALAPGDVTVVLRSDLDAVASVSVPLVGAAVTDDRSVQSGDLGPGDSFQQVFTTIGTFDYHCHPHPWMVGSITVDPGDANHTPQIHTVEILEPDPGDGQTWMFSPNDLTIHANDTVVFVNKGQMVHDVRGGFGSDGHDHDHHDHGAHGHGDEDNGIPGPGLLLIGAAIVLAGRRRGA